MSSYDLQNRSALLQFVKYIGASSVLADFVLITKIAFYNAFCF